MGQNQLQQAYQLIREGRTQEAIQMIEPILRSDPNNRDAWWLLANATNDSDAKRRALNEVLRLGNNDSRAQKAQQILATLPTADLFDDLDPIPVAGAGQAQQPQYDEFGLPVSQSQSQPVYAQGQQGYGDPYAQKQQSSGPSCWVVGLAMVGVIALLCCGGTFFATTFLSAQLNTFLESVGIDLQELEQEVTQMEAAGASDEEIAQALLGNFGMDLQGIEEAMGIDLQEIQQMEAAGASDEEIAQAMLDNFGINLDVEQLEQMEAAGASDEEIAQAIFGNLGMNADSFTAFTSIPETFTDLGTIDLGQTVAGEIANAEQVDGYRLSLGADSDVRITIAPPTLSVPPTVLIYDANGTYISENNTATPDDGIAVTYLFNGLPAGDYTVTVRPLFGMGVSSYQMTVE